MTRRVRLTLAIALCLTCLGLAPLLATEANPEIREIVADNANREVREIVADDANREIREIVADTANREIREIVADNANREIREIVADDANGEVREIVADVPYLTGRVVDNADILSAAARDRLTAALKAHEDATTNQVVVLTVPTIGSDSVEEYAVKVFEAWKLGQKGKDNGVLVVVVPQDRKMRIEVGYGLEPTLTDGTCGEIIRTWMTPAFKAGDYDKGVEDGVAAIVSRLEGHGEPTDRTPAVSTPSNGFDAAPMPWPQRILMGVFIFSIIGLFTVIGVMTPGVGWFLYVFLIPFWAMFPMVIIGSRPTVVLLGLYLIGYPLAKLRLRHTAWYEKAARELKTKGRTTIGGFTMGGGGSSGGGGFSGGGGSSGGGGASGSW